MLSPEAYDRLTEKYESSRIEVGKHEAKKQIDDYYSARQQQRLEEYQLRRNMASCKVSIGADGQIWYALSVDDKKAFQKELLPSSCRINALLFIEERGKRRLLQVKLSVDSKETDFLLDPDEEDAIKKLGCYIVRSAGSLGVGRRYRDDALSQLLVLLMLTAEKIYLYPHKGWNRGADGSYIFVCPGELTFKEVQDHAV